MTIRIERNGNVTITMEGFVGGECLQASKNVEEALGKVDKRDEAPEMYQEAENVLVGTNE